MFLLFLQDYLPFILDSFRPDVVLYDAGVDPHKDDELGKLNLSDKGMFNVSNII
jgi:Deacetylases, including yeast histone deacetylase and acetoin utilization protein